VLASAVRICNVGETRMRDVFLQMDCGYAIARMCEFGRWPVQPIYWQFVSTHKHPSAQERG
jgi:hypothetical protein